MGSINRVFLVGNLGNDPETKQLESGKPLTTFRMATTESWNDKTTGERVEDTQWHRIVSFGKTAELAAQYLNKGRRIWVEGRLKTRKWQDTEGKDRYMTEIVADGITFLDKRNAESAEVAS